MNRLTIKSAAILLLLITATVHAAMASALGAFDTEGCVAAGAALPRDLLATLGSFR